MESINFLKIYLRPYTKQVFFLFITILLQLLFSLTFPMALKIMFEYGITRGDTQFVITILAIIGIFFIVSFLSSVKQDHLASKLGSYVMNDIRLKMYNHLLSSSPNFFRKSKVGNLISLFSNDFVELEAGLINGLPYMIFNVLLLVGSILLIFIVNWTLALVTLIMLPITIIVPKILGSRASAFSYTRKNQEAILLSVLQENIIGQAVIRTFRLENLMQKQFRKEAEGLTRNSIKMHFNSMLVGKIAYLSIFCVILTVLAIFSILLTSGTVSTGTFFSFMMILVNISNTFSALSKLIPIAIKANGGAKRINEFLQKDIDTDTLPHNMEFSQFSDTLGYHNITFGYEHDQSILKDLSFQVKKGESIAIIGQSGSGKSTILNLLMGFYKPLKGKISIDGININQMSRQSLLKNIAVVFQDSFLFNTTVRENIRMGKLDATDDDIIEAAKAAEIHDTIMKFPQGYNTLAGESGGMFSGGERQRIAIARALILKPAIILLDEATSALDLSAEIAILSTLKKLARKHTIISVTHRLSTVIDMDRIYLLDQGSIAEKGTHKELIKLNGLYCKLWKKQDGFVINEYGEILEIKVGLLKHITIFSSLDKLLLRQIARLFIVEQYDEGQSIIREGEIGHRFYVIVKGEVAVLQADSKGKETVINVLQDGDYFGEVALIKITKRTATVRTILPTYCLSLGKEQFLYCLKKLPGIRKSIEDINYADLV